MQLSQIIKIGATMKVRDLLSEIERCKEEFGKGFLDWDVYTEQIGLDEHPDWKWLKDSEDWDYIECCGFWTKFPKEKVFTVNVNF